MMELLGFPLLGAEKKWECCIQTLGSVHIPSAKCSPELLHICCSCCQWLWFPISKFYCPSLPFVNFLLCEVTQNNVTCIYRAAGGHGAVETVDVWKMLSMSLGVNHAELRRWNKLNITVNTILADRT